MAGGIARPCGLRVDHHFAHRPQARQVGAVFGGELELVGHRADQSESVLDFAHQRGRRLRAGDMEQHFAHEALGHGVALLGEALHLALDPVREPRQRRIGDDMSTGDALHQRLRRPPERADRRHALDRFERGRREGHVAHPREVLAQPAQEAALESDLLIVQCLAPLVGR